MKIAIGLATRGDDIVPSLVTFVTRNVLQYDAGFVWKACGWSAQIPQEAVYQEAVKLDVDYLLMVDSDVTPPFNALDRLLADGKDVISAPIWHYDAHSGSIHLNITKELGWHLFTDSTGIEKICSSSFGCLLISKKVLQKFKEEGETFVYWSPMLSENFKQSSSDVILFEKIKKFGFDVYVDWDIKGCVHYTKVHLCDAILRKFWENFNKLETLKGESK